MAFGRWAALLLFSLIVTALAYLPGLSGGFLFDDYVNIVHHQPFRDLRSGNGSWWEVATGMEAGPTRRPISMLSFGVQVAGTGFNPRPMKIFNLAVHLANGVLLFMLLLLLGRRVKRDAGAEDHGNAFWMALFAATAWLLAPVNLTGVLYVVQRMESLAALFTLLGLLLYVVGRERMLNDSPGGLLWCWTGLLVGIVMGGLAKESAFLTPLYALVMEFFIFRFRGGQSGRRLFPLYLGLLAVPGALGGVWLAGKVLFGGYGNTATFTLGERLLTEARVLWEYAGWILLPRLQSLGFYHDDYPISRGWLEPWTTLPAVAGLVVLLYFSYRIRRRHPLVALGIWWFFSAHLLTATVIPLELVFEHRNYVASMGLLLSLGALIFNARLPMREVRAVFAGAFIVLSAFLTTVRAATWGDPLLFAMTTASHHAESPRANFELGYTLLLFSNGIEDPRYHLGMKALREANRLGAGLLPAQAAIFFASTQGGEIDPFWWKILEDKVKSTLSRQDYNALYALVACRINGNCRYDVKRLARVLQSAYRNHPNDPFVTTFYANYALNIAADPALGLQLMQRAVELAPRNGAYWENLTKLLIFLKKEHESAHALERIWELQRFQPASRTFAQLTRSYREAFGKEWHRPYEEGR